MLYLPQVLRLEAPGLLSDLLRSGGDLPGADFMHADSGSATGTEVRDAELADERRPFERPHPT